MTGRGVSVAYSSSCVDVYYVVKTLSAADEAVLLGVGPFGDGVRNGVVDSRGDGLIVNVFVAERPCVFSRFFDTVDGVIVCGTFWEKDSWGVVETFRGFNSVHHSSHRVV